MKKTIIATALFTISVVGVSMAQEANDLALPNIPKTSTFADLSAAVGADVYSIGLGVGRTHGFLKSRKIRVGYGIRAHGFAGNNLTYITAPAELTLADPPQIDTFKIGAPITAGVSAVIHLGFQFTPKLYAGFNIDAVGIGFGATSIGTFESSDNTIFPAAVRATPTGINLLLVGDNDIGQLKSQLSVKYHINEQIRIGAGVDFHFSEYTTVAELTNQNDRFRYKAMMGFVGVSYNLESKYDQE